MKSLVVAAFAAVLALSSVAVAAEPKPYVAGTAGLAIQGESERTNQFNGGVAAGLDYGMLRGELSYDRLWSVRDSAKLGEIDADLFALKGFVERDYGRFTPFVGAGIGYVWMDGDGVGKKDDGVALIGTVGASYALSPNWSLIGAYEYIWADADALDNKGNPQNWDAHLIKTGLRYTF